jgi:hypothetical protein
LLGNKFLAGRIEHRSGKKGGGFILTDTEFFDGEELLDDNEIPIDLGKYISVVVDTPILRNTWLTSGYLASFAACYGGFYLNRIPQSAPTNKVVSNTTLYFKQGLPAIDDLVGSGYVVLRNKAAGVVVVDAPTASMPLSDWKRLSTVRIVKSLIDAIRTVVEPYIGEGTSSGIRASIKSNVEKVLQGAMKSGAIQRYNPFEIIQTPIMEVQGKMEIPLTIVPNIGIEIELIFRRMIDMTNPYEFNYSTFSGADIKVVIAGKAMGTIQGVSYNVTREKAPIYTMGSASARAWSRGKRAIAGSLVCVQFDHEPLMKELANPKDKDHALYFCSDKDDLRPEYSLGDSLGAPLVASGGSSNSVGAAIENQEQNITSVSSDQEWAIPWHPDQLPPFDIIIVAANEYGALASMKIIGVEILNNGHGVSIDDIVSEHAYTFGALDIEPYRSQGRVPAPA